MLEIDFVKFIANIGCEQMTNFFYKSSAFWSYFLFPKSCLKSCLRLGGAAYTQVQLIQESLQYISPVSRQKVI